METLKIVHHYLIKVQKTLAVAESCTGGLLSAALTALPGSSAYFMLGCVTYSNSAKSRILSIPANLIRKNGAVSDPVCKKMAAQVRALAKTDFGIAVTGIAGPSGATPGKPAGTVYIALSTPAGISCRRYLFKGSRSAVRMQSRDTALKMLAAALKKEI